MFEAGHTRCMLWIFQCFGLTGVRVDKSMTPIKCWWLVGFITFIMVYLIVVMVDGFKDKGVIPDLKEVARLLTDVMAFFLTFLTLTIIFIQVLATQESQAKMLTLFNEADFLASTKLHMTQTKQLVKTITKLMVLCVLFIAQEGLTLYVVFELNQYKSYWIHMVQPVVIATVRMYQFIFFVEMLKHRLKLLNDGIRELMDENAADEEFQWMFQEQEFERKFGVLREIYNRVHEIYGLVNTIFGNSMLLIVFQCFVFICTNTYWSILQHTEKISSIFPLDPVFHIVNMTVMLFVMVETCEGVSYQAREMKSLVDQLSWKSNRTIQDFALQISHNDFIISANGFFRFNFGLLGSIFGSVVTYIVIMAQFEQE